MTQNLPPLCAMSVFTRPSGRDQIIEILDAINDGASPATGLLFWEEIDRREFALYGSRAQLNYAELLLKSITGVRCVLL